MNCSRRRLIRYTMYTHCRPAAFFFSFKERERGAAMLFDGRAARGPGAGRLDRVEGGGGFRFLFFSCIGDKLLRYILPT